jgi:hypothetical protein
VLSNPDIHETTPDVSNTFNIVGGTLAFILPLIAANAVNRNKEILNNYKAFCGDVLALGWEVLAYVRNEKTNNDKNNIKEGSKEKQDVERIQQIFELCLILPTMVKWKFRGGLKLDKVWLIKKYEENSDTKGKEIEKKERKRRSSLVDFTKSTLYKGDVQPVLSDSNSLIKPTDNPMVSISTRFGRRFIDSSTGEEYWKLYVAAAVKTQTQRGKTKVIEKGIDECDLIFAFINKLISEFNTNGDTRKNMLTRTAERVYGSYGNIGNIEAYKLPLVYNVYLYISMLIFVLLYPLNYAKSGGELIAMNITGDNDYIAMYNKEESGVVDHGNNIIWHGLIIVYFLFGFHFMTSRVGNVFDSSSNSTGYATVGADESELNKSLLGLYRTRTTFRKGVLTLEKEIEKEDTIGLRISEGKRKDVNTLHNRKRLYV